MVESLPEIIRINIPFIVIIGLGICSAFVAFWIYRRTTPPIAEKNRILLGSLRGTAIFLTMLLLFGPTLYLTYKNRILPNIEIYVDNSGSMSAEERPLSVKMTVDSVRSEMETMFRGQSLSWFTFNKDVQPLDTDTIPSTDLATDFGRLLTSVKMNEADHVFVISDGINTEGQYRLNDINLPETNVYTIGIGKEAGKQDVYIANVVSPAVAYLNQETGIKVRIGNRNVEEFETTINLFHKNSLVESKIVRFAEEGAEQIVEFSILPEEPGLQGYRVEINPLDSESNRLNNSHQFATDIMRSQIRVAIVSGKPSFESKFISLLLSNNSDIRVRSFTENGSGDFFGQISERFLDSADVMVFEGFPGSNTSTALVTRIQQILRSNAPGNILFINDRTDFTKLRSLSASFFTELDGNVKPLTDEIAILLTGNTQLHPMLQVFAERSTSELFWSRVPPLNQAFALNNKSEGRRLIEGLRADKRLPIVTLYERAGRRSVLFNGAPFWRWHFSLQNEKSISEGYDRLLAHAVQWVASSEKLKPLMMKTSQKVVNLGERVSVSATLMDASNQMVADGLVMMDVEGQGQSFQLDVENDSSGSYLAEFWPPGAGTFTISGTGTRNGMKLGEDRLEIEVIPFNREYLHFGLNEELLKQIAERYNGIYVTPAELDKLENLLPSQIQYSMEESEIKIWYRPLLLLIIISIITLEWILRKRNGLV